MAQSEVSAISVGFTHVLMQKLTSPPIHFKGTPVSHHERERARPHLHKITKTKTSNLKILSFHHQSQKKSTTSHSLHISGLLCR